MNEEKEKEEGFEYEPYFLISSCSCEHFAESHNWMECTVEGCDCQGHWTE